MANRYNDQDYPRYNERDDRYNSRSEFGGSDRRNDNRNRGGGRENERDEGYYGTSDNRDFGSGQQSGFSGGYFGSDFGRGYNSQDRDYDDSQSSARPSRSYTGGFGRNTRDDRDDYTLYGYDRDSNYSSGSDEERGNYGRGGDYGYGSNFGSSGSNFDRMSASDYTRGSRNYGRGSGNERTNRSNQSGRENFYGRSSGGYDGDYMNSERGWATENRGGSNRDERGWWEKTSDEISSWFGDDEAARRRERDQRMSGGGSQQTSHRGKGPKNYRRSDDRIRDDVNDRLTDYPYLDASDIEVEVSNGEVTLSGTVESRYAKRMAEDVAENVSGVANVENRLRVRQQNTSGFNSVGTGSASSSSDADTGDKLTNSNAPGIVGSPLGTATSATTGALGTTPSSASMSNETTGAGNSGEANSTTGGRTRSKSA